VDRASVRSARPGQNLSIDRQNRSKKPVFLLETDESVWDREVGWRIEWYVDQLSLCDGKAPSAFLETDSHPPGRIQLALDRHGE
jgi:hypothetical protein